jgi:predicted nucleic acid-binding protein
VQAREVGADPAEEAIEDLQLLWIIRHAHLDLLSRAWQLHRNIPAYDAMYLALAESLDATVVTCDGPLAGASRRIARIELIR